MTFEMRPRRSVLYMPGANERALEKAVRQSMQRVERWHVLCLRRGCLLPSLPFLLFLLLHFARKKRGIIDVTPA